MAGDQMIVLHWFSLPAPWVGHLEHAMKAGTNPHAADARTIQTLNGLLKGEIAATETYSQAISKIDNRQQVPLHDGLDSHARRAVELRSRIISLGGMPEEVSGPWGAFARLIERSPTLLGRDAALATLEEGEDQGLRDYRAALATVDGGTRMWLETELLPAQIRTHAAMSEARNATNGSTVGGSGVMPTMLMAAVISFSALIGAGCQEERRVGLNEVTPEARTAINKITGTDQVTSIEEITTSGKDVIYHVEVTREGKVVRYTVTGNGEIRD